MLSLACPSCMNGIIIIIVVISRKRIIHILCTVIPNFFLHYTVPEAVDLLELNSTTDSITAHWAIPNGIVESYDISCERGTPSEVTTLPSGNLSASCTDLTIPGDDYRMDVTAVSNGQRSQTDSITITASM